MKQFFRTSLLAVAGLVSAFTAFGQTYYVNAGTGNDGNTPTQAQSPATPWATLGVAVFQAPAGATIVVAAGTYSEDLVINKSLSLVGPKTGIAGTGIGRGTGEAIIGRNTLDSTDGNIITITASNVSIDGFTIDGNEGGMFAARGIANGSGFPTFSFTSASNIKINNNRIIDVVKTSIRLQGNFASPTSGHEIKNNWITMPAGGYHASLFADAFNFKGLAVLLRGSVYATVTGNNIVARYGIETMNMGGSGTGSIASNTIHPLPGGLSLNPASGANIGAVYGVGITNLRHYVGSTWTVSNNSIRTLAGQIGTTWVGVLGMDIYGKSVAYTSLNIKGEAGKTVGLTDHNTNFNTASVGTGWAGSYLDNLPQAGFLLRNIHPSGTDTLKISNCALDKHWAGIWYGDTYDTTLAPAGPKNTLAGRGQGLIMENTVIDSCLQWGFVAYQQYPNPTAASNTWPVLNIPTNNISIRNSEITEGAGGRSDRAGLGVQNFFRNGTAASTANPGGLFADLTTSTISLYVDNTIINNNRMRGVALRGARRAHFSRCRFEGNGFDPGQQNGSNIEGYAIFNGSPSGNFPTLNGLLRVTNSFISTSSTYPTARTVTGAVPNGTRPRGITFGFPALVSAINTTHFSPRTYSFSSGVLRYNSFTGFTGTSSNFAVNTFGTSSAVQRIDAGFNWWGSAVNSDITARVSASGLDFNPFLTDGTDQNTSAPGFQPSLAGLAVTSSLSQIGAIATVTLSGAAITAMGVEDGGSDHQTAPAVTVSGGTSPNITANISGGKVTGFTVTSGGSGFNAGANSMPVVTIAGPGRLREAILAAEPGATINVEFGNYSTEADIVLSKSITLNAATTTGAVTLPNITVNNATLSLAGNFISPAGKTLALGTGGKIMTGTGRIYLSAPVTGTTSNFTTAAGTRLVISGTANVPAGASTVAALDWRGSTGSLLGSTIVTDSLKLASGTLTIGANTLTVNGAVLVTTGNFGGTAASSLVFGSGTATNVAFTSAPNNRLKSLTTARNLSITSALRMYGPLDINGTTLTTNGNLTLASSATLGQGSIATVDGGGAVTGNVTAQKYIDGSQRWVLYGPSVSGQSLTTFAAGAPGVNGINPTFNTTPPNQPSVWFFNNGNDWTAATGLANTISVGQGLRMYVRNAFLTTDQSGNGLGVLSHTGAVSVGNFNFSGLTDAGNGWNLVANPYPSAIDWETGWTRTNVSSTYHTWVRRVYGSYAAVSGTSVNGATRFLPMHQGFFVKATGGTPTLTASEISKVDYNASILRQAAANLSRLRVSMNTSNDADETAIVFMAGAADAFEAQIDGEKLTTSGFQLASMDNNGVAMSINHLAELSNATKVVPLRVSGAAAGNYTLNFSEMSTFAPGTRIYLIDNFMSTSTDITLNPSYAFAVTAAAASQGANRFEIHFVPAGVTGVATAAAKAGFSLSPNPATAGGNLQVTLAGVANSQVQLSLYNATGQQIMVRRLNGSNRIETVELPAGLAAGVYQVMLNADGQVITQKLVINQ